MPRALMLRYLGMLCGMLLPACVHAHAPSALFYMLEQPKSIQAFMQHADQVDVLVPTWYAVDDHGTVTGQADARVMQMAKAHGVAVMPIVSAGGDRAIFHRLLGNAQGEQAMIASLIQQAQSDGYSGFQFDFENIDVGDRAALTALVTRSAAAFHRHALLLTMAIVPDAPGKAGSSDFSRWMWQYWRGAYDIKALAEALDLVCLMTYDQHTRWTPPGPVAGMPWTLQQLAYALQVVPKDKLSLGIPLYGYHWYAGNPVRPDGKESSNIAADYIDFDQSEPLARQFKANVQWDSVEHEAWFYFYRDQLREWVSMPDAHAFRDRYNLIKPYGLQGFCAWVLGAEDPQIWKVLPTHHPH